MRCLKANRTCGGYENLELTAFRRFEAPGTNQPSSPVSMARKCSMPKRVPILGSDVLPEDGLPSETSEFESNELSLKAFLYDFRTISDNQNLSRGFLSGLETTAYRLGLNSDLVKLVKPYRLRATASR